MGGNSKERGLRPPFCFLYICIMIVKKKDKYVVISKSGKRLGGPYSSRKEALKRLRQVEYFKNK